MVDSCGPAYDKPALRHSIRGGKGCREGMIVSSREYERVRICAGSCGNSHQRLSYLEGILAEVDHNIGGLRHMPEIGQQAIRDVDHGRGSSASRARSRAVAHLGYALCLDEHAG